MLKYIRALLLMGLASVPTGLFAGSIEAKTDDVPVLSEPAASGKVVKTLKKGEVLESKERKGMFWEVALQGGKTGYVSFIKVQRHEGESENSLAKAIREKAQGNRQGDNGSGRARSAVMGVRGLDEDEDIASAGSVRPNLRMVYSMEDRKIDRTRIASIGNDVMKEVEQKMKKKGLQVP